MKNIPLLTVILFIFNCTTAQTKTHNLGLGVSPYGMNNAVIRYKTGNESEKMKIDYNSYKAAQLFYEKQFKGSGVMMEFSYAQADLEKVDKNILDKYQPDLKLDEKITTYSFHLYGIITINKQKRVQLPIYLGVGGDYIEGGPVSALYGVATGKARLKIYLTNKFGIYGGYSYDYGLTYRSLGSGSGTAPRVDRFISNQVQHVDAGITFSL